MIKDIPGYPGFNADSEGHIWGLRGHRLKWQYNKGGYPRVTVGPNTKQTVHQLVCLAFHGPRPAGKQIRHLDSDKNNTSPDNFLYGTSRENADDAIKCGSGRGSKNGHSKLKEADVIEMRAVFREKKMNQTELAKKYGVTQPCIFYALQGFIAWRHVPDPCKMGAHKSNRGSKAPRAKLNEKKVVIIRKRIETGESDIEIAKDYGVAASAICRIRHGYTYRYTTP